MPAQLNNAHVVLHAPFQGANNAVTAKDFSRSAHSLTFNGGAKISTAQSYYNGGSSVYFDGVTNSQVSIADSADFNIGSLYTIKLKFCFTGTAGSYFNLFGKSKNLSPYSGYYFAITDASKLLLSTTDNSVAVFTSVQTINPNQWYDITMTCDGTLVKLYINGILDVAGSSVSLQDYAIDFCIGNRSYGKIDVGFVGFIQDFMIVKGEAWNTHKFYDTTLDAKSSYLKAAWKFGDYGVYDCVGANTLTNNGTVTFSDVGMQGYKTAYMTNDRGDVASPMMLSQAYSSYQDFGTGDFAIAMWINMDEVGYAQGLFSTAHWSFGRHGYVLGTNATNNITFVDYKNGNTVILTSERTITASVWHHIVITRVSGVMFCYIDGSASGSVSSSVSFDNDLTGLLYIGGRIYNDEESVMSDCYKGYIQECVVYKGAGLPPTEIALLYNSGKAKLLQLEHREHKQYFGADPVAKVDALVVAGGGGGAANCGNGNSTGGGGGGEVRSILYHPITVGSYGITVGSGGTGGTENRRFNGGGSTGSQGSDSVFSTITAVGGGFGGGPSGAISAGGSGGNGGGAGPIGSGGSAIGTAGYAGGVGNNDDPYRGGGGGGAGGEGASGASSGNGGIGVSSDITGTSVYYGGGGGGGTYFNSSVGSGGNGGGGAGGAGPTLPGNGGAGVAGTPNTGGGGGGGGAGQDTGAYGGVGGNGGSGIVVIRYQRGRLIATGGTITQVGDNTIHTFTSDGTFEVTQVVPTAYLDSYSKYLVANWKLDEMSGTRYDSAGFNHLTDNGGVTYTQDATFGRVATFNGSSQYFTKTSNADLNVGTGDFTISLWFNQTSYSADTAMVMDKRTDGSWDDNLYIQVNNLESEIRCDVSNTQLVAHSYTPDSNVWHHLVFVRASNSINIYLDNVAGTPETNAGNASSSHDLWIGAQTNGAQYFNGKITNIEIYKGIALDATAIAQLYNAGLGRKPSYDYIRNSIYGANHLIASWPMQETSGNRIDTRNGYAAVDNGSVSYAAGKTRTNCADFSGSNNFNVAHATYDFAALMATQNFSLLFWIKFTVTSQKVIFDTFANPGNPQGIQADVSVTTPGRINMNFYDGVGGSTSLYHNGGYNDGNWHRVAITVTGPVAKLYVDNTLRSMITNCAIADSGQQLAIGALPDGSVGFIGQMQEVDILDTAVDEKFISDDYNDGVGIFYRYSGNDPQ